MILNELIRICVGRFGNERTASATLHLLSGRRSVQTTQDAHFYQLSKYYGLCPFLNDRLYEERLQILKESGDIFLAIDDRGQTFISLSKQKRNSNRMDLTQTALRFVVDMDFRPFRNLFLERILLSTQTISNMAQGNDSFIPIVDSKITQHWFHSFYRLIKRDLNKALEQLYQELTNLLKTVEENEAALFVDRLTGIDEIGLSITQLAQRYTKSREDIKLTLLALSEAFIKKILKKPEIYPLLHYMVHDFQATSTMSTSANETFYQMENGKSIDQIAIVRNLRLNTIHDHLVEITLAKRDFSIRPFVSETEEDIIQQVINEVGSLKLKILHEAIPIEIKYYQIRLVLARNEHRRGEQS